MRRLRNLKQQEQQNPSDTDNNNNSNNSAQGQQDGNNNNNSNEGKNEQPVSVVPEQPEQPRRRRASPAQLRAQTDIQSMDAIPGVKLEWPDPDDFMHFNCTISPDEGLYAGTTYTWSITVPSAYPHEPPKCLLKTLPIYHPNIDWEGKPCLNILRDDWRPVLTLGAVLQGLLFLYLEPNPYDPLNHEVADLMKKDEKEFERNVYSSLRGGVIAGRKYQRLI